MRILKILVKFAIIFVVVFVIYTLIYHYQVSSRTKVDVEYTFLASDEEISQLAEGNGSGYGVTNTGLTEDNINKDGFYIRIDRINLFKPVIKNVDPRYKEVYQESWKTGVSHGKFTALPDQIGNVYLFAHAVSDASRLEEANAWFSLIDLLAENDEIIIYYERQKYTYQVSRIYTVSPSATGVYTGVSPVPKVTLQTCGPPRGSLDSRYMVEALQEGVEEFI
jgi:LPXTG-site transpeptidase (sortase) family protein